MCSKCHASYAQRQGAWRHIRRVHNPKSCFNLSCEFKWARPYEYRSHLKTRHPGVDPNLILGKAPDSRGRAIISTEYVPQQPPGSPPAVQIEQGQQNRDKSEPYPSTPPSPTGARVTSVSPPAVSSVNYHSQHVYAEPRVTMDEYKYVPSHAVLLSTEERVEPLNDWETLLDDQFGYHFST